MKRTILFAAAAVGCVLTGCAQQQNPSGKITKDQVQAMSGRPPTPEELRRAQASEARAVVAPARSQGSNP